MPSDTDWVGRDLQRLAKESKLLRRPTDAEWERIWRAATDWADAIGVITTSMSIDSFIREHAPGVLREPTKTSSNAKSSVPPPANTPSAQTPPSPPDLPGTLATPEARDRTRRAVRSGERSKPTGKPAAS
jgi:hypothetical protein